ncbi:glucose-6-phosphate dehydrogenase [Usitatibacter palustris]|uniref:Glucose-6-phosphate 1-dehydrogenase n=1 Tax=Usitatibacter palustris TaxID=2732487 RepID=A0A6M4HDR3_9PROT|nr:glucose-6-phosphate dehydrogenase [Usitatibacter palustris]QJR16734.1 Glucose-6-phosphate 1-dehydrogenase [Usitatibacter palustris]
MTSSVVLFGATGDLARRMLWPSLYALDREGLLPQDVRLVGAALPKIDNQSFVTSVGEAIRQSANAALFDESGFAAFAKRIQYVSVDASAKSGLDPLRTALGGAIGTIFYLATGPKLVAPLCAALKEAGLADAASRVVIEKPIGSDAASAARINEAIAGTFAEDQVFRIDHYLGKEAVQNLVALRFANAIYEPLWNKNAIEQVEITVAETVGVDGRWAFYNEAGALRDMVQSHLLQLLCLVAMEPPASFTPSAVRNEKVKVLWSLRPIGAKEVATHTARGQYEGYLKEEGASATSETETFVAIRAEIDNWRWAGVPFHLKTGKRLAERSSEIVIRFKSAPFNIFADIGASLAQNTLLIKLQPEERITMTLMHKEPGLNEFALDEVGLDLSVSDAFPKGRRRIAYERMLLDVFRNNSALFVRRDEVEAAWKWIDGIIAGWKTAGIKPKPYKAGTWGPRA